MSHKTKAALPGRQCQSTKLKPTQHSMLADLVNYQPFGSMPRCCSSLRSMRLIQVARDESPSLRISSSNWALNSSFIRIGNCGDLFSGIDMVYAIGNIKRVYTSVYAVTMKKQRPGVVATLPRRLTKPLYEVTIMADIKSTQTRLEFTWRFLATTGARITVVYTNACTESEARANCPGWKLIFAARFPLHQFEVARHA